MTIVNSGVCAIIKGTVLVFPVETDVRGDSP